MRGLDPGLHHSSARWIGGSSPAMTDASKPRFSRCNHIVIPYDARAIDQGSDKVDTGEADEVIDAIARTVAELTSQQAGFVRQKLIEQLMRQIMHYDGEDLCSRLLQH
jgi:hypothetical protein